MHEQAADAAGRGGDHHDVVVIQVRLLQHGQRRSAGAHHRHGLGAVDIGGESDERLDRRHRLGGVPAAGRSEMGDDGLADPRTVDIRAHRIDESGHLATRCHRQMWHGKGAAGHAGAHREVEQVHTRGRDGDPNLPDGRLEVGDLLDREHLGSAEPILTHRLHARHGTTSSLVEVKARSPVALANAPPWRHIGRSERRQ